MKSLLSFLSIFVVSFFFLFVFVVPNHADQLDDLTKQINDLTAQLNSSINATRPLESQLTSMQKQIAAIKSQVAGIDADVIQKQKDIDSQNDDIVKQEKILGSIIRDYYIRTSSSNPLLLLLSTNSLGNLTNILAYQQAALNQDKATITNLALSVIDLEQKQKDLEDEKNRL